MKIRVLFFIGLFSLAATAITATAFGKDTCEDAYAAITRYAKRVDDPAISYAEESRKELLKRSESLNRELDDATKAGHPEKVNLVVIGGGPHSAELYSSYHSTNPNLKAVVFERTEEMGTFDRFGSSFSLNSREMNGATGNPIYGSSVKVSAFNREHFDFVPAERMGDATVVAHNAARTPLAFHQEVTEILERPDGANWPGRYLVKTARGTSVYTDVIVAAPGMGTPSMRITDPVSTKFVASEAAKAAAARAKGQTYAPLVETLDDALARARELSRDGKNFLDLYKPNERVAVIGANYGSMISVEALAGVSPDGIYPGGAQVGKVNIVWVGQKSATFEEFKAANTNPRYWPTLEKAYATGKIIPQGGHVIGWRPTTGEEMKLGKVAILMEGTDKPVYVDRVITGMGYENKANDLFKALVPAATADKTKAVERVLVQSKLDQAFPSAQPNAVVPISQRVRVAGREHDIFLAGQATGFSDGKELPTDEWKNAKGGFLDVLGRRSEALGRDLAQQAGGTPFTPVTLATAPAVPKAALSLPAAADVDAVRAELDLRVSMQRALYPVRLPAGQTLQLSLTGGTSPSIAAAGIDQASLDKLKTIVESDSDLRSAMAAYLKQHPAATLSLGSKADGRPIFESMELAVSGK